MMKIRVVSSKKEIDQLNRNEQMIHLAFRASNTDIFRLLQACPRLRAIQVPSSYYKTMSHAGQMFLEMQGIEIVEGDVWGHRKDIDEYYTVDDKVIERINSLQSEGMNHDEIASKVSRESKLSPAMVKYMIKQAT
ncbi:MAG: hypothetical protein A4E50_01475 [Methanosaeta sp. PtaB.Bin087]|jgi:hypothetical protein|nr:MAG: hypothetical protein A4E50_01475 [Methanosaeta sp. PtaB.Bin087]OPY56928.1 MAG: hypothetical protein A4E51_00252 [Methanosaeta sp. PtaU1.Bin055]